MANIIEVEVVEGGENSLKVSRKVVGQAERLAELRSTITKLEAEAKGLHDELLELAGEATSLIHNNLVVVSIARRTADRVDTTRLKTEFPEIYELVLTTTTSKVVNVPSR
jgi:predicted phage-related endonuclease